MITTIIFDLSEVYLKGLKGTEELITKRYGTKVPLVNPALMDMEEANHLFHGKITEEEYWKAVIMTFQVNAIVSELQALVRENFEEIPGTRNIIEALKHQGYKLGLLSVHVKEWIVYCDGLFDFNKLFDVRVYSFEVAVSKPEKRAYEIIMEKMQVTSTECLFIDDRTQNLVPARELGMTAVQFIDAKALTNDLRALEIRL